MNGLTGMIAEGLAPMSSASALELKCRWPMPPQLQDLSKSKSFGTALSDTSKATISSV
jgi:predicted amidohydrolase